MEQRTPKTKRLSLSSKFKSRNDYGESSSRKSTNDIDKTPTHKKLSLSQANDCSPVFIPHTQEALDQLDVIWDWNSPESKKWQKQPVQKQVQTRQSPKPIKRHTSNSHIESYDKLKYELEALKNQLVESRPTDKHVGKTLFPDEKDTNKNLFKSLDDLFDDDSFDEEMILQSQKIEELLTVEIENNTCDKINVQSLVRNNRPLNILPKIELRKVKSDSYMDSPLKNYGLNKKTSSNLKINNLVEYNTDMDNIKSHINDVSFDHILESFNDEIIHEAKCNIKATTEKKQKEKLSINNVCNAQEIKQKKLNAIAKLQAKKQVTSSTFIDCNRQEMRNNNVYNQNQKDDVSPIKCSPEEIEKKRLQALAKLEAKKKQEKIERNRREALKRLEMNKKKRSMFLQNHQKK